MIFDDIEGLTPELKAALEDKVKGQFVPKTEFDAVFTKKEELLSEKKKAQEIARQAQEAAEEERRQKALKDKDFDTYRASFEEREKQYQDKLANIETQWKREKIGTLASQFVAEKFVQDPVIMEAIGEKFARRLDLREGKMVVLDAEGNLTALSVEDLKNEFLSNGAYKAHIIATGAAGGGAAGGAGNPGGANNVKPLAKARTPEERRAAIAQMTGLP